MRVPTERDAIEQVRRALAEVIRGPVRLAGEREPGAGFRPDAVLDAGRIRFVVEWKGAVLSAVVRMAAEQVRRYSLEQRPSAYPLVAVPFMGEAGQKVCEEKGVNWIDLSGNAGIRVPGMIVDRQGRPNAFKRVGRPSSPFAPRSSRLSRWLLLHPGLKATQRELAQATALGDGFVSRLVARLVELDLIARIPGGKLKVTDHGRLLDAWREAYGFESHQVIRGYVAARSGEELLREVHRAARAGGVGLAFTGLSGAWLYDRYAGFRLVTAFLKRPFDGAWLKPLSFRQEESGANLWLVRPRDEGVFEGAKTVDGMPVVNPVQVYLDLKGHPERAAEAAEELRKRHLSWRTDG